MSTLKKTRSTKADQAREYLRLVHLKQKELKKNKDLHEESKKSNQMQILDDKNKLEDIERLQEELERCSKNQEKNQKIIGLLRNELLKFDLETNHHNYEEQKMPTSTKSDQEPKRLDIEATHNLTKLRLEISELKNEIAKQETVINQKEKKLIKLATINRPVSARLEREAAAMDSTLKNVQNRLKLLKHTENLVQTNDIEGLNGLLNTINEFKPEKPEPICTVDDAWTIAPSEVREKLNENYKIMKKNIEIINSLKKDLSEGIEYDTVLRARLNKLLEEKNKKFNKDQESSLNGILNSLGSGYDAEINKLKQEIIDLDQTLSSKWLKKKKEVSFEPAQISD
ncbi:unnamed protein product [Blepharisma stoltei]|uniref:Uncharacterized protein n=1 Tax=Blepharisma stoltei TaxID=1481888 RepID=A0AAU9INS7_9CILI|nr:unnamed protein product [Blepharisma stoltei]